MGLDVWSKVWALVRGQWAEWADALSHQAKPVIPAPTGTPEPFFHPPM